MMTTELRVGRSQTTSFPAYASTRYLFFSVGCQEMGQPATRLCGVTSHRIQRHTLAKNTHTHRHPLAITFTHRNMDRDTHKHRHLPNIGTL